MLRSRYANRSALCTSCSAPMSSLSIRLEKLLRALTTPRRHPLSVRRILIAHQLLLGDTILLAPLLKQLERSYPDAQRVLLVRPAFMPLFQGRPYGVSALPFSRRDQDLQRAVMQSGPYDLAIVPDDNRYAWLARAAGASWIVGFGGDRDAWKNFMLDDARSYDSRPAAWADMAARLAWPTSSSPSSSFATAAVIARYRPGEWPAPARPLEPLPAAGYTVLHVGASTPLKGWSVECWNGVIAQLRAQGRRIVFSGASNERSWLQGLDTKDDELAWFGRLDLAGLWHLLAGAAALVCPDTGIAHLARVVGVPSVALFGPGSAVIHGAGAFWADSRFEAVTAPDFPCRDQTVLFRRQVDWVRRCGRPMGVGPGFCPGALCMRAIELAPVLAALDRITTT